MVRVKICCIKNIQEASIALSAGASALGLVGAMPSGPGIISDESIAEIAAFSPPSIGTFLLTSETSAAGIIAHWQRVKTNTIQIVDALVEGAYTEIRAACLGIKIIQVLHIQDESSVEEALSLAPDVDAFLLDSGNPTLAIKQLGGTGRTHNWQVSRKIVEACGRPVFLAGGLHAGNVRDAIETVQPFGIDLCSGVRTNGLLDADKLNAFMKRVLI